MIDTTIFNPVKLTTTEEKAVMTPLELAEYLNIGKNKAYDMLRKGEIKGWRIGGTWRVSKIAVDLYIKEKSGLI